jgi:hypothetical protein
MIFARFLATLSLVVGAIQANAWADTPISFEISGQRVKAQLPPGWKKTEDLFGMDATLAGHSQDGIRPTIVLNLVPKHVWETTGGCSGFFAEYKNAKTKWIQKKGGRLESIQEDVPCSANSIYQLKDRRYSEFTWVKVCTEGALYLKSIADAKQANQVTLVKEVLSSIECK